MLTIGCANFEFLILGSSQTMDPPNKFPDFECLLSQSLLWGAQENLRVTCESPAGSFAVTCEPLVNCLHDLRVLASRLRYL